MADVRLTINLPEEWLDILKKVADQLGCSVNEYMRLTIEGDPHVQRIVKEAELTNLPEMSKKWGGRRKRTRF